jgi:hypothetical protein
MSWCLDKKIKELKVLNEFCIAVTEKNEIYTWGAMVDFDILSLP